jgi:superoxide dismutase
MEIHYGRHHEAYVDNLNAAVVANPVLAGASIVDLLGRISTLPAMIRNNGGGHWDHSLFWTLMAPVGQVGEPPPPHSKPRFAKRTADVFCGAALGDLPWLDVCQDVGEFVSG